MRFIHLRSRYACIVTELDDQKRSLVRFCKMAAAQDDNAKQCDTNRKEFNSRLPLHHAAQNGEVDIVRKLVHVDKCDT